MSQIDPPKQGATSVRFGPAFLRPSKEKDHYELMRPIVTVSNGDKLERTQHSEPIGPLAVYRVKRRGDKIDMTKFDPSGPPPEMKTSDPKTGQPMELILEWWPGKES
jgi:hypothetical protein